MRLLHKIYASFFGYFWIPCPLCGEMFGGHEEHSKYTINHRGPISTGVCKNCEQDAKLLNVRLVTDEAIENKEKKL